MHDFHYHDNILCGERVRLDELAAGVGTPCYVYSRKTMVDHLHKIQRAFADIDPLICYAMKANGNLAVVRTLVKEGAGVDIVSKGELLKALKAGADPKKIVFASVGKTDDEILTAIKKGILLFNVESRPELERINTLAGVLRRKVDVALRINPDVEAPTHDFISTGTLKKKFGIDLESARQIIAAQRAFQNLNIAGLHMHIGSQITQAQPFVTALTRVAGFIEALRREGLTIRYLDIGGGWGIIYKDEKPQTAAAFAKAVKPILKRVGAKVIMEPGRFIMGNAGVLLTRVLYLKDNGFKKFLIVDAGMNDLIRPSLYGAYHDIKPVVKVRRKTVVVDVVGPICESGDYLGLERRLPVMKPGEVLAVMSAGAYGFVMASNYNIRPRPPEVLINGDSFAVVRRRERYEDLWRLESLPAWLK